MEIATCPVLVRIIVGEMLFCHRRVKFQSLLNLENAVGQH
jgi:hypothetical protein